MIIMSIVSRMRMIVTMIAMRVIYFVAARIALMRAIQRHRARNERADQW